MEAPTIYPTSPFDSKAPVDAPSAHAGMGDNVESPGKAKGMLGKFKHQARKLKDKIKTATGSNTASTQPEHDRRDFNGPDGKDVDHGPVYDDDDEEDDYSKSNDDQLKYEQLRSIGALDNQSDGSEVEVHGGVPVSTLADSPGTHLKKADDDAPISPYKSAGPADALQATPTEYRNYAADDDPLLVGEKPTSSVPHGVVEDGISRGLDKENNPLGSPSLSEVETSNLSYHDSAEPHTKHGISDTELTSDVGAPYAQDVSPDRKLGVGLPSEKYSGSGERNLSEMPEVKISNPSDYEPAEPHSKHDALDTVSHPDGLVKPNPSFGTSSSPIYDKIAVMDEDMSADRKLGVGLSSEHGGSGEGNLSNKSVQEFEPEVKTSSLSSYDTANPQSKYGVSDTTSASDIDVPYPEDLVKPNPSFGKSSSPTYDKIGVMNEDLSSDGKLEAGLSSEEHSGSGKGNLLQTSVPELEELSGYRGSPSVPLEKDELVYRPVSDPEVGSSLTSPPGRLDDEPNAVSHSSGTDQYHDNRSGVDKAPTKGENDPSLTDASSYGEQKPDFDIASEQPADVGIATAGDSEQETRGNWSADESRNVKDVTGSGLTGTDHNDENETRENITDVRGDKLNNPVDVIDNGNEVPNLQDGDMAKPRALEDEYKDVEEEFYNPNEVKDNQFEEGFTHGSAEEDALSGTVAGSAIGKLQGLKETVQSSLGYDSGVGGEDRPGFEGEEKAPSPASHQQQKGGFVQGLKETVASSLGYGKASSDEAVHNNDVSEGGQSSEPDVDNRQQPSGGTYQVLKNVVSSKLGYGTPDASPKTKQTESREFPAEPTSHEPSYDEEGGHQNVINAGHVSSDGRDNTNREGVSSQPDETHSDTTHTESASIPAGDNQPSSYTQKLMNTTAAARDYLSSRIGYGNSHEDKGEGEIGVTNPSAHVDNNIDDKSNLLSK